MVLPTVPLVGETVISIGAALTETMDKVAISIRPAKIKMNIRLYAGLLNKDFLDIFILS